jgi:hypothetical protein
MIFLKDENGYIWNLSKFAVVGKEGTAIKGTVVTTIHTPDGNEWAINAPYWCIEYALSRGEGFYDATILIEHNVHPKYPCNNPSRPFKIGEEVIVSDVRIEKTIEAKGTVCAIRYFNGEQEVEITTEMGKCTCFQDGKSNKLSSRRYVFHIK